MTSVAVASEVPHQIAVRIAASDAEDGQMAEVPGDRRDDLRQIGADDREGIGVRVS